MDSRIDTRSAWAVYAALLFGTFITIEAAAFQAPALPSVTRHFGIPVDMARLLELGSSNSLGIMLGLLCGKPLGIVLACAIAVALKLCHLPDGVGWRHIVGAGILGGIGFTMSIFITNLAFADQAPVVGSSKLAVLIASLCAGIVGVLWLMRNDEAARPAA